MLRAAILYLLLIVAMGSDGIAALSDLTGLQIYEGTYQYLDGTKDVAIEARGKDEFGWHYKVLGRWRGGYPQYIFVMEPEEKS